MCVCVSVLHSQVRDNQEECVRLREATKRLYVQLKELEKKQKEEKDRLQVRLRRTVT